MSQESELDKLRHAAKMYRDLLIRQYNDNDIGTEDLRQALEEAGLDPYGASNTRSVTLTFKVGWEDSRTLITEHDIQVAVEAWFENLDGDEDWVVPDPSDVSVVMGPVQRGNLPS